MSDETIERGIEVVAALAHAEPTVADLVDVLESVVESPDEIRTVLRDAEEAGLIERTDARVVQGATQPTGDRRGRIIRRDGDFSCRRCGRQVTTGQFVRIGESEIGPYGSTCIKRITGRD